MNREILKILAVIFTAATLGSGCAHRVVVRERVATPASSEVVVSTAPPPPKREVISVSPGPRYVWVDGYWARTHNRWVWVRGHYEVGPHAGAVWVKGHWDHTERGWVWVAGHWA